MYTHIYIYMYICIYIFYRSIYIYTYIHAWSLALSDFNLAFCRSTAQKCTTSHFNEHWPIDACKSNIKCMQIYNDIILYTSTYTHTHTHVIYIYTHTQTYTYITICAHNCAHVHICILYENSGYLSVYLYIIKYALWRYVSMCK